MPALVRTGRGGTKGARGEARNIARPENRFRLDLCVSSSLVWMLGLLRATRVQRNASKFRNLRHGFFHNVDARGVGSQN